MIRLSAALLCVPTLAQADLNVVADIAPIHSLTAQIMGDTGTPALILPTDADAHDFAFRPSDARTLQDADIVIMVGPDLTPWLVDPVITLAAGAQVLTLMETEGWEPLAIRSEHDHGDHGDHEDHEDHSNHAHEEHDDHDPDEHDTHSSAMDPHAWQDPTIAAIWAEAIAEQLTAIDPENAATYAANLATTRDRLAELDAKAKATLTAAGSLLWPHDGYQYLEVRYGLDSKGSIADLHANTPGPGRIQALLDMVADQNIGCILTDRDVNGDWIALMQANSDVPTAFIDGVGGGLEPGPDLYETMMMNLVTAIAEC
ncbi:zinc transport system substrate-binding protein [Cognatiyoonia koreensis]|uniref:High-affinity zinc uptake system protein ZnuA n=1 Tax=Cognatiyoonia koreensis TaxID=364200 RepID=A0A1I0QEJ5_9RHOB|nr:zinc ABC transporter substrate-binding protein [Cognatiyoonia koreensis]SEW25253.1 zinc transport system substrate-binding protein [Cognatiyoonia koreensis]